MNLLDAGRRVKQRRQELGLNQQEVADRAGVTRGYVSRLENGKSGSRTLELSKIVEALGLRLADLIGETDAEMSAEIRRRTAGGDEIVMIFERIGRAFGASSESNRQFIRRSLETLADHLDPKTEPADDA